MKIASVDRSVTKSLRANQALPLKRRRKRPLCKSKRVAEN